MNKSVSEAVVVSTTAEPTDKIRLAWLALGCSCLAIGSFYLSTVDLGRDANLAERQKTVAPVETSQAIAE